MERKTGIQLVLPNMDTEMGPNFREILIDYDVDAADAPAPGDFHDVCKSIGSPMIIGHDQTENTSLFMSHDIPIDVENISSQLAKIRVAVIGTNFGKNLVC